jgi:hypothetical protein
VTVHFASSTASLVGDSEESAWVNWRGVDGSGTVMVTVRVKRAARCEAHLNAAAVAGRRRRVVSVSPCGASSPGV